MFYPIQIGIKRKSSIGLAVAQALNLPFVDADDLHPANNVEKMANSIPLNDEVSSSYFNHYEV